MPSVTMKPRPKAIAIEANTRLAEQRSRQVMAIVVIGWQKIKGKEITVNTWLDKYWAIQEERLKEGDIKPNTYKQKGSQSI